MFDLIGDIHGHADELVQLLETLGYQKAQGAYRHPERKVIFLGDFIDRGPKIRQVLEIVRPMIEEGKALAVMGNHELNALALKPQELRFYLDWFRALPMWLGLDGLRVVHACWDEQAITTIAQALKEHRGISPALLESACKKGHPLFAPVEVILKGKEAALPKGKFFYDNDRNKRTHIRSRWYLSPQGQTYRTYALQSDDIDCDLELEKSVIEKAAPYPTTAKPVFVGHYWLSAKRPELLADNVACLDFSVAKGGFLCAYRWQGEQKLSNENFVSVTK